MAGRRIEKNVDGRITKYCCDGNADTVQTYEYSVYGQVAAEDPNHPNPYMFTGRRFDVEIGLYYYRARYYDPFTGRFLQTDPVGYGDGMNMYAYCKNNSLNWVDPSGNYEIAISIPTNVVWHNFSTGDLDTPEQHKADVDAYLTDAGLYYMFPDVTLKSVERRGYYYDAIFDIPDDLDISMDIYEVDGIKVLGLANSEGGTILLMDERLAGLIANKPGGNSPGCGQGCDYGILDWVVAMAGAFAEGAWDGIKLTANGATFDLLPDDLIDRDGLYDRYGNSVFFLSSVEVWALRASLVLLQFINTG